MVKSHKDVPQEADLQLIPRWARVALVGRTLRRVLPLLLASWPAATKKFQRAVEWAIAEGESAASQATATADLKNAGMAAMDVYGTQPMRCEPAGYIAFSAARVSFSAREPQADSAQDGIEQAAWAVYWYEFNQKAKGITSAAVTAIWTDYNHLKAMARREGWTQKTPVPPEVFGPLWPKGAPKTWPQQTPPLDSLKPKRKRVKVTSKDLGLPPETIDFLRSGGPCEFDSSLAECGPVTLKPLAHLVRDEFAIVTDGTPAHKKDPHRGETGNYVLRVVDLVGECDAYDPDGLLAWMCDYKMFGSYDVDHHRALVFPRASWADIAASPVRYLNAQWSLNGRVGQFVREPWKHCEFRPE